MKREIDNKAEWFRLFRERYRKANRSGKKSLLDELISVHGMHRKSAIRLMAVRRAGRKAEGKPRGPKPRYQAKAFTEALRQVWRETKFMSSKLLKKAMSAYVPSVEKHYSAFPQEVKTLLFQISPAQIDRILKPYKFKSKCGTKPGTLMRNEIPIQGSVWDIKIPGFIEADTVAHCGNSLAGEFVWTLTLTDICTQWTECRAVWHKGAAGIVEQIKDIESILPFSLRGFDCDNGSEFLNNYLIAYFSEKKKKVIDFTFTRSRPYHSNDNAHVEQKNWSHPRQLLGRERLEHIELVHLINDLYKNEFSLLKNFFHPNMKLDRKIRANSRFRRFYGSPMTPYERVLNSDHVPDETKTQLQNLYQTLDPIDLQRAVDRKARAISSLNKKLNSKLPEPSFLMIA